MKHHQRRHIYLVNYLTLCTSELVTVKSRIAPSLKRTFGKKDTGKRHNSDKNGTHPVEPDGQPATGGQEEEPGLGVQVLVVVKLLTELLLDPQRSDCVQTLERGT